MPWFWQAPPPPLPGRDDNPLSVDAASSRIHNSSSADDKPNYPSSTFLNPTTLLSTACLTTLLLSATYIYRSYLVRIPNIAHLPASLLRHPRRTLLGRVTSVGDADNFRLYHTPGGLLAGWGWLRHVPTGRKALTNQTLHIRVAGVDAPELAHFGNEGQPAGQPAMDWLTQRVSGKTVRVRALRRDQYERLVGTVALRRGWSPLRSSDLGMEMLQAGWAQVYEAKKGAEFAGREQEYRDLEALARKQGKGMWGGVAEVSLLSRLGAALGVTKAHTQNLPKVETPREYKTRTSKIDGGKAPK